MRVSDMRINLSCVDGGVAEELLDRANVGAIVKKIGGEDVPQDMRCHFFRNAGFDSALFNNPFNGTGRETRRNFFASSHVDEERIGHIFPRLEICRNGTFGGA